MATPQCKKASVARQYSRILIIRQGGIGDAALLASTIMSIRNLYPSATIDILAERRNVEVFNLISEIDSVYLYDKISDLIRMLFSPYDLVLDTEQWHFFSALVARLTRASVRIGFATNERSRLFTHSVPYSHDDYEAESFLNLLKPLGLLKAAEGHLSLKHFQQDVKKLDSMLGVYSSRPFVAIFPGASVHQRRWKGFGSLVQKLCSEDIFVVVVGGADERKAAEKITSGTFALNIAGKTSIVETAAIVERSTMLVSGDSGILHIGVSLKKPTVSLFGPGIEKKWGPRGKNDVIINKRLPCSPCTKFGYTPKCPLAAQCISEITVDEVVTAVLTIWKLEISRQSSYCP